MAAKIVKDFTPVKRIITYYYFEPDRDLIDIHNNLAS